nr:retrotransposon protein, putative, Ty1-copia subclass [Tanacetum cinerariifolium]
MCEIFCQSVQKKQEEKRIKEEQAAKAQSWKFPVCYDDDDDEESSNPLEDNIISELPSYSAVTPTEPIDSLRLPRWQLVGGYSTKVVGLFRAASGVVGSRRVAGSGERNWREFWDDVHCFNCVTGERKPSESLLVLQLGKTLLRTRGIMGFFEKQKLTGPNFIDWYRKLRILLSIEDRLNYLEQPISPAPVAPTSQHVAPEILAAHAAWIKGSKEIEEGQSVSSYVLKIKGYIDNLERLGHPVTLSLGKVNKHKKPQPQMAARGQNHGKGKNKLAYAPKPNIPLPPKRKDPAKDSICLEYGETGQRKRNCPQYLAELPKKKKNVASGAGGSGFKAKLDLEFALLWHCHLGHISKKRIKKLQHDGLLTSTDLKAFEKCVSCMSGKMARKPYTHQVEREKDLFGLTHTDVCGPFKIMSRQGANYFVTFTDDFNRYGYVYLLKHKHEVFETFKVFQKEVENQLGKTIKSLRSDRGGEYMSQEFLDHLKDHGIIAHHTPTYTPQHNDNEDWVLVKLPPNGKTVGSKWLFKKKTDMDGVVHTYKDCLVAKGYTQTPGLDYEETFSPVADIRAIRILIAITAYYDYEIWQMDVKTAFLNGYLNEEVYMEQPEGFVNPKYPNRVCKLKRSIYGLKKASRQWNKRFDDEINKFGFTQNRDEPCVYLKAIGSNITFLILYVDDILIMGNNIPMLQDVKSYLGRYFSMKDLGEAAYILRIKIYRYRSRLLIGLCQSAYIKKILKRYYMKNSEHGSISMQEKLRLSKSQGASTPAELKRMQNVPYASANPSDIHWTTVKNIMKYLRNTKDMFLVYGGDLKRELKVSYYTDAGYLTDADDLKSQTGYVFVLNGGAVDWKSAKQSIFATSFAEAEYIAAFDAFKEAVWVRKFISGLGVVPTIKEPISMYCDNTKAIAIANESRITKGARHFRAKVHYLHEVIEYGDVKLEKVHIDDSLADPFTKALAILKHSEHTRNIGMLPATSCWFLVAGKGGSGEGESCGGRGVEGKTGESGVNRMAGKTVLSCYSSYLNGEGDGRTRVDPSLLNNFKEINMAANENGDNQPPPKEHLDKFLHVTQSIKENRVTDDALRLYLFPHSLTHHATAWFDRLPRNSITTFEQMAKMFIENYFPPSMVTKLRNEITNFCQRPDESLFKAWERYKLLIDRCPNHNMLPVTQIDTFYNRLTLRHRDTINAAVRGTFMKRRPKECYNLIENMTIHHNDWDTSAQRSESSSYITSFSDPEIVALKAEMAEINKNLMKVLQINQQVKAVTLSCETCGGPHAYNDCPANVGQTQNVYAAGAYNQGVETQVPNSEPVVALVIEPVEAPVSVLKSNPDRSISHPVSVAEDVSVKVGKFHFLADFVVGDFDVDPRVPLILRRSFLKTGRALIDVYEGELTLRVGNKAVTFNLDQTSRYSSSYDAESINQIDVIDVACEEYSQEVLGFFVSGNPTPSMKPLVSTSSPTLTPFGDSDFPLEETGAFLAIKDEPISPEIDDSYYDLEGDILLLEELFNDDPSSPPLTPQELKVVEPKNEKSSSDEPPVVELKNLPPHLEYAFLEGDDKLPIIIAKDLKDEEKTALIKVLKSHK